MIRNRQKTFFHVTIAALLVTGLGMLASCGGGGGGGAAPAPPTAPGAFSMTAPASNAPSVVPTPTLSWGSASGVTTYTVEVTTNPTFSTITTFQSTTIPAGTTSIVVSSLSPSTVYYWRVKAVNSIGSTTATGAPFSFTTKKSGDVAWSQTSNPSPIDNQSFGMAIDGNGLYVVGYDSTVPQGDDEWRIEKRSLSDGSLVTSFGTSTGVVTSNPSLSALNSSDKAYAVAVDSNYMYVVGYDSLMGDTDREWRIEKRYLNTGGLVTTFGTGTGGGYISENPNAGGGFDDEAFAVAVDSSPTGTVYIVGYESPSLMGLEWRIEARDKATGMVLSSVTSSISTGDDTANAIAIDSVEGYMYVVGTDSSSGNFGWRIEKRTLAAPLSLETTTFGGATGYVYEDVSSGSDEPLAIALDPTYIYIAGYEYDIVNNKVRWRIEKRNRSDGSLENITFGGGTGFVVSSPTPTPTSSVAQAIAIDSNYMYVAGYDNTASGSLEWRIEKRDLTTGALVTDFGTGGIVVNDFGTQALSDSIRAISVDSSYIYVAGFETLSAIPNSQWRIEKLVK